MGKDIVNDESESESEEEQNENQPEKPRQIEQPKL